MSDVSWQIDGSGELVAYDDHFKDVTEEDVQRAELLEKDILRIAGTISTNYLSIARDLSEFKEKKYYRARGFESFRAWADSPNLKGIGYRTAHDLIRIYEHVLPILARNDAMETLPMIQSGKMRALLPILGDEGAEEKIIEAAYAIQDLTTKDSYAAIHEIRDKKDPFDDVMPTVFKARVRYGETFHKVTITAIDNEDIYDCGVLSIKTKDWKRWESRFGRFIEVE